MEKVKTISLENFKFFNGKVDVNLERKNLLLYGENGSGKSSIYWSLYTFLQSVFKLDDNDISKYFINGDESLRNKYCGINDRSGITLVFEDDTEAKTERTISNNIINTKNDSKVKLTSLSSDFLNYKLLSEIYNFRNSQKINLFPLLTHEILEFITFREELIRHDGLPGTENAKDWWLYIKDGIIPRPKMNSNEYSIFIHAVNLFNQELDFYLSSIMEKLNAFLIDFKQNFSINYNYSSCTYDDFIEGSTTKRNHKTIAPEIILVVENSMLPLGNNIISKPHTFLNEAKLNIIALSLRLAMVSERLSKNPENNISKLLVLDDLLLSLDMSNREIVLDILLTKFPQFQILMLTHDKLFFEIANHKIHNLGLNDNWKKIEIYQSEVDGIPQPYIKEFETHLQKAEKFFHLKEYEISGNQLRKEAENFCKEFLPKRLTINDEYNILNLDSLIENVLKISSKSTRFYNLIMDLKKYKKFVLNASSHDSYDIHKFNNEILGCLNTMKEIRKFRIETLFKKGDSFSFSLKTVYNNTYDFEISIKSYIDEDILKLVIDPDDNSYFITKGRISYKKSKDGILEEEKNEFEFIDKLYSFYYDKSDKNSNSDYRKEIVTDGVILETFLQKFNI